MSRMQEEVFTASNKGQARYVCNAAVKAWPLLIPTQSIGLQVDRQSCMKMKGLSTGCRHLLTRMLRADPRKRATISEIMRHPWFQADCPQVWPAIAAMLRAF